MGRPVICVPVDTVCQPSDQLFSRVQWLSSNENSLSKMGDDDIDDIIVRFDESIRLMLSESVVGRAGRGEMIYNIVVIGKTGVGKTQLVNYLLGEDRLNSAVGLPVTPEGFHGYKVDIGGIPTKIYDSAGIELGNPDRWIKKLEQELFKRKITEPISEWFHTVIYCVAAAGSRFEIFEKQIINLFLKKRYRVIVVITKPLVNSKQIDSIEKVIKNELTDSIKCVRVNSKGEVLDGPASVVISSYGRDELVREIQMALFESVADRVPVRCIRFMEKYIDEKRDGIIEYIRKDSIGIPKRDIAKGIKERLDALEYDIVSGSGYFRRMIGRETRIALDAYSRIGKMFESIIAEDRGSEDVLIPAVKKDRSISGVEGFWSRVEEYLDDFFDSWSIEDKFGEKVDYAAKILTSPFAMVISATVSGFEWVRDHRRWRNETVEQVDKYVKKVKENIRDSESDVRRFISSRLRSI